MAWAYDLEILLNRVSPVGTAGMPLVSVTLSIWPTFSRICFLRSSSLYLIIYIVDEDQKFTT